MKLQLHWNLFGCLIIFSRQSECIVRPHCKSVKLILAKAQTRHAAARTCQTRKWERQQFSDESDHSTFQCNLGIILTEFTFYNLLMILRQLFEFSLMFLIFVGAAKKKYKKVEVETAASCFWDQKCKRWLGINSCASLWSLTAVTNHSDVNVKQLSNCDICERNFVCRCKAKGKRCQLRRRSSKSPTGGEAFIAITIGSERIH